MSIRVYTNTIEFTLSNHPNLSPASIEELGKSVSSMKSTLNNFSSLGSRSKSIVLGAISIAKHSSKYWHDNYAKWRTEFGNTKNQGKTQLEIDWKVVGGADIAAGVSTGILTSTALVVPLIGWGAWAAVTGAAALIASAGAAIIYAEYCIPHLSNRNSGGTRNRSLSGAIIAYVSFLDLFNILETTVLSPRTFARSVCFRPRTCIRILITSTGSPGKGISQPCLRS